MFSVDFFGRGGVEIIQMKHHCTIISLKQASVNFIDCEQEMPSSVLIYALYTLVSIQVAKKPAILDTNNLLSTG